MNLKRALSFCIVLFLAVTVNGQKVPALKEKRPTVKEAIMLIMKNSNIPLTVDPSCKGVGSELSDKTIGDYIAGLLSFQTEKDSKNWITFNTKRLKSKTGILMWQCDLMFYGNDGREMEYSWGLRFTIPNGSRQLLRKSVRCTGSG